MAEAEGHEPGGEKHHETKKDKRNHQLTIAAVAVGIVGAVFAWLSFRKGSGNVPYTYPAMPATTGVTAGSGNDTQGISSTLNALGLQQRELAQGLANLAGKFSAIPAGAGIENPSPGEMNSGGGQTQIGVTPPSSPYGAPNMPGAAPTPGPDLSTFISNPAGYADSLRAQPWNLFTPSPLDYASEQPGGVRLDQQANSGGGAGHVFSVYSSPAGADLGAWGPVLSRDQIPTGERVQEVSPGRFQRIG